jgi:hypothetical protein
MHAETPRGFPNLRPCARRCVREDRWPNSNVCGSEKKLVTVAVGPEHGLREAVVSLPDVKGARGAARSTLDQKGCEFHPDVLI